MNIFITGANRGIGYAQTKRFLEEGDIVFATYRDDKKSEALLILQKKYNNRLYLIKGDVTNPKDTDHFYQSVKISGLDIDILINNAGIDYEGA